MLEGSNAAEVLTSYERAYPELGDSFREQSHSLSILYGYLADVGHPSDSAIAMAYQRFAVAPTASVVIKSESGFFARLTSIFASQTTYRLVGATAVVVVALLAWRPWSATTPLTTPVSDQSITAPPAPVSTPTDQSTTTSTPSSTQFRGADDQARSSRSNSPEDLARLRRSLTGQIQRPNELTVEPGTPRSIRLTWQPVEGALSYIVEIKTENDQHFHPVAQVAHAYARIGSLPSGHSVSVRVTATKGRAKGPSSDAQSIVVP
ncbi:MAG: fibronectin type III domain-containing protein [Bacteroidetes bacterium]|nr:fibronectin type III domain-containing protein [Bacteroidota bacterium]